MLFRKCLLPTAWPLSFHMLNTVIVFILGIMLVILLCLGVGLIWGKQKLQCELDFGYINWNPNSQVACEMKCDGQYYQSNLLEKLKWRRNEEAVMKIQYQESGKSRSTEKSTMFEKKSFKNYTRSFSDHFLHFQWQRKRKNQTDITFRLNKTFCLTTG